MGNETPKTDSVKIELAHPKCANVKLIKKNEKVNIQVQITCDELDYNKWYKKLQIFNKQESSLLLPITSTFSTNYMCGSRGTAIIDLPYYPYLLSEEVYNRYGKKTRFQQTDLWYLLYTLSSAVFEMSKHKLPVGDIRTGNIFLNDEGSVKVANLYTWPLELRAFEKAIEKEEVYLAPEQFQRMTRGETESENNIFAEMFAVGWTILNSATLDDSARIYDFKNNRFDYGQYEKRTVDWANTRGYSDIFKATVLNLISINPEDRMSPQELYNLVEKHAEKIMERQNFIIDNAPSKLHSSVKRLLQMKSTPQSLLHKPLDNSVVIKHQLSNITLQQKERQQQNKYYYKQGEWQGGNNEDRQKDTTKLEQTSKQPQVPLETNKDAENKPEGQTKKEEPKQ